MRFKIATEQQADRLRDRVLQLVADYGPLLVTVTEFKPPKTRSQNALFHALVGELAPHLGYSEAELKTILKDLHGPTFLDKDGNEHTKSLRDYSKEELSVLIERVYQEGAESGFQFSEAG